MHKGGKHRKFSKATATDRVHIIKKQIAWHEKININFHCRL